MNSSDGRSFEYILRDFQDNRYLGHMTSWFAKREDARQHRIGESIPLPDQQIFENNSKRIRKCIIKRVDYDEFNALTILYLLPTNVEIECSGRLDGKKLFEKKDGIDWSGTDGWLKFD